MSKTLESFNSAPSHQLSQIHNSFFELIISIETTEELTLEIIKEAVRDYLIMIEDRQQSGLLNEADIPQWLKSIRELEEAQLMPMIEGMSHLARQRRLTWQQRYLAETFQDWGQAANYQEDLAEPRVH